VGCLQAGYLLQAVYGQDELSYRARHIGTLLAGSTLDKRERALLSLVAGVKRYGERHGLSHSDSYTEYVQLNRSAVAWIVVAAPPLALEPKTWTFPIVGSVPYLGWFNQRDAQRYAARLQRNGYDVDLRAAHAYSTLGWLTDPVVSSMLPTGEGAVGGFVEVLLHESVHATLYVPRQSIFNESLADFVSTQLTYRYLRDELHLDRWQRLAYEQDRSERDHQAQAMAQVAQRLSQLYRSRLADADKRAQKRTLLTALQRTLHFERPINNAVLLQARTYHSGVALLDEVLRCIGGDWQRFWKRLHRVDEGFFASEQQTDLEPVLRPLTQRCRPHPPTHPAQAAARAASHTADQSAAASRSRSAARKRSMRSSPLPSTARN